MTLNQGDSGVAAIIGVIDAEIAIIGVIRMESSSSPVHSPTLSIDPARYIQKRVEAAWSVIVDDANAPRLFLQ